MTWRRLLAAVCVSAAALGMGSGPAVAAPQARIDHVEPRKNDTVDMLFSIIGLPQGVEADPETASVAVDGEQVDATASPVDSDRIRRTTVLALDTSDSMRGARFEAAKSAALAYLDEAPDDIAIGLVSFDSDVTVTARPTIDRDTLRQAIAGLDLDEGTALYDGVIRSIDLADRAGAGRVLVLSDGGDTTTTPVGDVIKVAEDAGVPVDVVAIRQPPRRKALLGSIAEASGGAVIPAASPDALTGLFEAQAEALSHQLEITFTKPASVEGEALVEVSVDAGGATYADTTYASLSAAPDQSAAADTGPQPVVIDPPLVEERGLLIGTAALAFGLAVVLAIVMVGNPKAAKSMAQRQLERYTVDRSAFEAHLGQVHSSQPGGLRQSAVTLAQTMMKPDFEARLTKRLTAAGIKVTAAEWLLVHTGIVVASAFVGLLLGGGSLAPALIFLALGGVAPAVYLGAKRSRRIGRFNSQLAETLQLISGGLSAGLSLPQAMDSVVREGVEPMAGEMRRALAEQRLGVDVPDALDGISQRMDSKDFAWIVMAVRIQREVGGNLAQLLLTVASTLRERDFVRRQVKTLSAEGRLSAWILGGLPVVFMIYLLLVRPSYVEPMFTTTLGWLMLAVGAVMLAIGAFVMSRLVKIEI